MSDSSAGNVSVFISEGSYNWKKVSEKFNIHEKSKFHKSNVIKNLFIKTKVNVYAQMADSHKNSIKNQEKHLIKYYLQ